ncbi:hypothetical protein XENOCAPTIV_014772 [Xenoophorus captivus]|uniref:Uncharacterized protein n=1 Tax=Xenoophorus captivus TaxID=1517983 RepID=A0ABV0QKK9_9TELE
MQCNCRVNPSCVMCGGWSTPREEPQFELPTLERLSKLDLGVHPILSFPDGLSHYKNRIDKQRTVDGSLGSNSSSSAVLSMPRLDNQGGCKTERLHTLSTPLGPYDKNYSRKRLREHSLDRADTSPKLFLDTSSPCTTLANMHSSLHSPLTRQLSTSSDTSTQLGPGSQSVPSTPVTTPHTTGRSLLGH